MTAVFDKESSNYKLKCQSGPISPQSSLWRSPLFTISISTSYMVTSINLKHEPHVLISQLLDSFSWLYSMKNVK